MDVWNAAVPAAIVLVAWVNAVAAAVKFVGRAVRVLVAVAADSASGV